MPFLYESRQHKRTKRESLDCALALEELTAMGVSNIITFDAHDHVYKMQFRSKDSITLHRHIQFMKALLRAEPDFESGQGSPNDHQSG